MLNWIKLVGGTTVGYVAESDLGHYEAHKIKDKFQLFVDGDKYGSITTLKDCKDKSQLLDDERTRLQERAQSSLPIQQRGGQHTSSNATSNRTVDAGELDVLSPPAAPSAWKPPVPVRRVEVKSVQPVTVTPAVSKSPVSGLAKALTQPKPQGQTWGYNYPPHLIVEARAGTGKTTTLIEAIGLLRGLTPRIKPSPQQAAVWDAVMMSQNRCRFICFAAFNSSIAKELRDRVPAGVDAKTIHSMGFGAIRKRFNLIQDHEVNEYRVQNIIAEFMGKDIRELRKDKGSVITAVERLVALCKMNLISEENDDGWAEAILELARHHDIEMFNENTGEPLPEVLELVPRVLERCKDVDKDRCIDFNDQIWLPVVLNLPLFKFDVLFIDEAQDLNKCQQELAKRAGWRLVFCGDPKQSIYQFAGADTKGIDNLHAELSATKQGCERLYLTVTRRCGKAIVKEAQSLVPDFDYFPTNGEGKVTRMKYTRQPGPKWGSSIELPVEKTYLPHVQPKDMIVCRTVAPIVTQYFKLLKMGKRAQIKGKDIGQSLITVITKLKTTLVVDLVKKLSDWHHDETQKELAKKNPSDSYISSLNDKYECIMAFTEGVKDTMAVVSKIETVFSDKENPDAIQMSSVHKAKGLESHRVFFLKPDVQPKRPFEKMQEWEIDAELNIEYVAITRAIEELIYVH